MRSKNMEITSSWRQKVCHDVKNKSRVFMKSKIRHYVKKFVMKSKSSLCRQKHMSCPKKQKQIMTSTSSSWRQKVRHGVKNMSWWQKVRNYFKQKCVITSKRRHNVKMFIIKSKTRYDIKKVVRHDIKNTAWRQKVCHNVKRFDITSKVCHEVKTRHDVKIVHDLKNTSWRQAVRHVLKKIKSSHSKTYHDVNKFVMTSKSSSWRQKHVMMTKGS